MPIVNRFREAEEDLLRISDYIARDNPPAARQWLDDIEEKLEFLARQPYAGEAVNHIRAGVRRFTHGQYVIFYEPRDNGIVLIRVLHSARKAEDLL
jgi:toxin ParE1/3/4